MFRVFHAFLAFLAFLALALALAVALPTLAGVTAGVAAAHSSMPIETVDPTIAIAEDIDTASTDSKYSSPAEKEALPIDSNIFITDEGAGKESQIAQEAGKSASSYAQDELVLAGEDWLGRGARGFGKAIEDILKEQGQPNAYIVGTEGGGSFLIGLRYGKGTLYHKIEGDYPIYWTGPSIGMDAGGNAGRIFILVYNLFDSHDVYQRFSAGEGAAYLLGGFHISYLRRHEIMLIPIRVGVGIRLGANVGYLKFSKKRKAFPF